MIIPVLTAIIRLPMKLAVGTSLMIIAINSIIGFMGDIGKHEMDWAFLTSFIGLAVIGVGIGLYLSKFISNRMLKPGFGVFILIMGCWILLKELLLK
ncbi:TSUP family transporter [Pseudarcicella hirudinis]|uniref:TSUP family transporter n=1 Tax=Pseudarcicella hirudinis TaxID=1079859 RepID=UPI0035EDA5FD